MAIVALIPARGGSKGLPHKNIRPLLDRPLIAWSVTAALASEAVERVVVSTDSDAIARAASEAGAEVPFMRPAELATDETPDLPVLRHALDACERPDVVVWLRPTSPLRTAADIDAAVDLLLRTDGAQSVRSVCSTKAHPYWMKRFDGPMLEPWQAGFDEYSHPRRQLLPPAFLLNGAVEVVTRDTVEATGTMYGQRIAGYVMPLERSVDIDTELDLVVAAHLLTQRGAP